MRQGLSQALHHADVRQTFGKKLNQHPLMQNVLADLALESEAAIALAMRLARAFDQQQDEAESIVRRLLTPAAKFWVCKRGCEFMEEAMEVLGGNGYCEDYDLPRMYREMPVNSIWEGSGNIMCLDVLRALQKNPRAMDVLALECKQRLHIPYSIVIAMEFCSASKRKRPMKPRPGVCPRT